MLHSEALLVGLPDPVGARAPALLAFGRQPPLSPKRTRPL